MANDGNIILFDSLEVSEPSSSSVPSSSSSTPSSSESFWPVGDVPNRTLSNYAGLEFPPDFRLSCSPLPPSSSDGISDRDTGEPLTALHPSSPSSLTVSSSSSSSSSSSDIRPLRSLLPKEPCFKSVSLYLCSPRKDGKYTSNQRCSPQKKYYLFVNIYPQKLTGISPGDIRFMAGEQDVTLLRELKNRERIIMEARTQILHKSIPINGQFLPYKGQISSDSPTCRCSIHFKIGQQTIHCGTFEIRRKKRLVQNVAEPSAAKRPRKKDIAYWHLVLDEENRPQPGDVVAIRDGGISKKTGGPSLLTIVPFEDTPWKKRGKPESLEEIKRGVFVCYLGIVLAKVQGMVKLEPNQDHCVLASGNNDGFAVVKPYRQLTLADHSRLVGQLIESDKMFLEGDVTFVRTLISLSPHSRGLPSLISKMAEMLERLSRLDKYRISPCETSRIFGNTTPRPKEHYIERTDMNVVYERVFPQDDISAGPSQPYLNHCQVTIIYGQIDIGKTTLAKSVYRRAIDFKIYDQVGYFDVQGAQDPNIFVSFYSHFAIQQGESLPNLLSKYRILLIIDGCEDWQLVKPVLSLGCASHIVVTTPLNHLNPKDGDEGIARYHLGPLNLHDATALLRQYAITTPFFQEKIVCYAQGLPLKIIALAHLLIKNGVEGIDKILTGERPLCLPDTSRALTPIELDLYYALAYLKDWDPLPSIFIIHYWEWITQAAQHPWNRVCGEHLLHKLERREMIVLTRHQPGYVPLCSVLYPSPIETVTLHQHNWEDCLSHVPRIFPDLKIMPMVFDNLIQAALGGKYSFFLQYGLPPTDPILIFLLRMHKMLQSESDDYFVTSYIANYLSNVTDLDGFRKWTIACLTEHMFEPEKPPSSLNHASPPRQLHKKFSPFRGRDPDRRLSLHSQIDLLYRVPYCVCEDWAHETMRWFLQTHDDVFLDMIQPFVNQLVSHRDFYASTAIDIFKLLSIAPVLATLIIKDFTTRPNAFEMLRQNHNRLMFLKVLKAAPVGTITSKHFTQIVHMLIDKEIENWALSDSFPIECFAFFHDLSKFLHDPLMQSQLLDTQMALQKLEAPRGQPLSKALPNNS